VRESNVVFGTNELVEETGETEPADMEGTTWEIFQMFRFAVL